MPSRSTTDASDAGWADGEWPAWLGRLRRYFGHRAPAAAVDDLVQEAAARAVRYRASHDRERPLWPWLRRVADRVLLDHHAKSTQRPKPLGPDEPAAAPGADRVALDDDVGRLLARLSPRERQALVRFHLHGETVHEIAVAFQTTPGTVKSLLSRARHRLAEWPAIEGTPRPPQRPSRDRGP